MREKIKDILTARYLVLLIAVTVVYFLTGRLGLSLQPVGGFATLVWIPSGVALAALLLGGLRLWPAILVGAFWVNVTQGAPLLVATDIGVGNTLETLLGWYLLTRLRFSPQLSRLHDVLSLLFVGLVAPAVAATLGSTSLLSRGIIAGELYGPTWGAWWLGDFVGILIVTPFLLTWLDIRAPFKREKMLVGALLMVVQFSVTFIAFYYSLQSPLFRFPGTFIFPLVVLMALYFNVRKVTLANLVTPAAAILTLFVSESRELIVEHLFSLQLLMSVMAGTGLVLSAVVQERKGTAKDLRIANKALQKDIERRAELERMKDDFVSLASHQLRTPLTAVKWLIETLQGETLGALKRKQKEYLEKIYGVNEQMIALVSDMLTTFRIEAAGTSRDPVVASAAIDEAIVLLAEAARKNKITIRSDAAADSSAVVESDQELIKIILESFLSNAVHYSRPGSEVICGVKKNGTEVIFSIQDSGIGIPESEKGQVFERFQRASNAKRHKPDGTGLGLYIARRVADKIGGRVWCESEEGKGSTFYLALSTNPEVPV
jgi:signal transduction histidine kinase